MGDFKSKYSTIIQEKFDTLQKSCRNLLSEEDIRLVEKAFELAAPVPPKEVQKVMPEFSLYEEEKEILKILDIALDRKSVV